MDDLLTSFEQVGGFLGGIITDFYNTVAQYPFFAAALFLPLAGGFLYFILEFVQDRARDTPQPPASVGGRGPSGYRHPDKILKRGTLVNIDGTQYIRRKERR